MQILLFLVRKKRNKNRLEIKGTNDVEKVY